MREGFGNTCLLLGFILGGCARDSNLLGPNNHQPQTDPAPNTSIVMELDHQERHPQGIFKCFYIPATTSTAERLSVALYSKSCHRQITYDFTGSTWQPREDEPIKTLN
jgi:hypothetical protein